MWQKGWEYLKAWWAKRSSAKERAPRFRVRRPWLGRLKRATGLGSGWLWILVTAGFQLVSAWTNVLGLRPAVGLLAGVMLGVSLQLSAILLGYRMTGSQEPGPRKRLLLAWIPVALMSIAFSYCGVESSYERWASGRSAPAVRQEQVRLAAGTLAGKIDEARTLALGHIANAIAYDDEMLAKAQAKLQSGAYPDPADGEIEYARLLRERATLVQQQRDWQAFAFNPNSIVSLPEDQAWARLQGAHAQLATLWGSLRFREQRRFGYQLPSPPVPRAPETDLALSRGDDPILGPFRRLWPPAAGQLFWLMLAVLLETVPLLLAWSGAASSGAPPDGGQEEDEAGKAAAAWSDPALDEFHRRRRLVYHVDGCPENENPARRWVEIDRQVEPADEDVRAAFMLSAMNAALKAAMEPIVERDRLLAEVCERLGIERAHEERLCQGPREDLQALAEQQQREVMLFHFQRECSFTARMAAALEEVHQAAREKAAGFAALGPDLLDQLARKAQTRLNGE